MDQDLVAQLLTGDSDEIADLKLNTPLLMRFIDLVQSLESLPQTSKRFYEESRSLYQTTCTGRSITELEALLAQFFGVPVKPSGKSLPRKLRKNAAVKYLGGIEKDQSLFLLALTTGIFYGALWPWRRSKDKIEIHLGYCSDWMSDADYQKLETLVKRSLSHNTFQQMGTEAGGQIRGIGLPSFLQMAELEQSTFTLQITSAGRVGQLHIAEGRLIDAATANWTGSRAAHHIISWDDAIIEIAPADPSRQEEIKQPLMHLLMDSLKMKDEITSDRDAPPAPPQSKAKRPKSGTPKPVKRLVRLERPPEPRPKSRRIGFFALIAFLLGTVVVLGTLAVVGLHIIHHRSLSDRHQQLMAQVERTESLDNRLALLEGHLQANPQSPQAGEIRSRIHDIRNQIEDREFDRITLQISSLPVDEQYEQQAIALYAGFLEKYPDSRHTGSINAAISGIKKLIDQYYYEELRRAARLDYGQRLAVYRQYLQLFPEGRYQTDVNVLIREMGEQYLGYLETEDATCDQNKRWEPCIQRYQAFIDNHRGMPLADEALKRMHVLKDKQDLNQLRRRKIEAGSDFQQAVHVYQEYLASHPESSQKKIIEEELAQLRRDLQAHRQWTNVRQYVTDPGHAYQDRMQRLERYLRDHRTGRYAGEAQDLMNQLASQRQIALRQQQAEARQQEERARIQREQQRLAQQQRQAQASLSQVTQQLHGSQRYRLHMDGTATDLTTGLMWDLLDSQQAVGACMDYSAAHQYVQSLNTGGYSDWRLPTANELAALYKQAPFFPGGEAQWYWTSEAYVRGYHSVADVVTSKAEPVFIREHRGQDACGAVRAVRP